MCAVRAATAASEDMPVHRYLTENPEETARTLRTKALTCDLLVKISWVATIAIMAVVIASGYGVVLAGLSPLLKAGMVLSTPALIFGAATPCANWRFQYLQQAEIEEQVAGNLTALREELRRTGSDPEDLWLRGVARLRYEQEEAKKHWCNYQEGEENALNQPIPNRAIQFEQFKTAYEELLAAYKHSINGAIMDQILSTPFNQALGSIQPDGVVPGLGTWDPPTFGQYLVSKRFGLPDPKCLTFYPDIRRNREDLPLVDHCNPTTGWGYRNLRIALFPVTGSDSE